MTYKEWMELVDRILNSKFGMGHRALEDYIWRDSFDDELTPEEAVDEFTEWRVD